MLCKTNVTQECATARTAKSKYNFQPHYQGPGVGGPCLPVNAYQYLNSSKKIDVNFLKIVQDARKINEFMPQHVIDLLTDAFSEANTSLENSTIAILGISYKPNVHDVQIAPSERIIKLLKEKNANLKIFDPYFHSETVFGHKIENSISETVSGSDAVLIITGHNEFNDFNFDLVSDSMNKPILVDCTGKINPQNIKSEGVIFRGIGRGGL